MPQYLTFSEQNLFIFVYFCAVPFKKNRKKTAQRIIVTRKIAKKLQGTPTPFFPSGTHVNNTPWVRNLICKGGAGTCEEKVVL